MRYLIWLFCTIFLFACGRKSKEGKKSDPSDATFTTTSGGQDEFNNYSNFDSVTNYWAKFSDDTNNIKSNFIDASMIMAWENSLAPLISKNVFSESIPYNISSTSTLTTCDNFNSIERGQLRSGSKTLYTSISRDDDNKIKLFKLLKTDFKKNSKAFVLDYCNYLDTVCVEGGVKRKVRLIAGLRITYLVKDWNLNIGVDGLEKIAAAKELNFSESTLDVQTIGWGQNDSTIDALKESIQKISVKNYAEACAALLKLFDAYKTSTSIKPDIIPVE